MKLFEKLFYFTTFITFLFFQGCAYSTVYTYDDCVDNNMTFEFKDKYYLYIIDDNNSKEISKRYTSMIFEKGEHFLQVSLTPAHLDYNCIHSKTYKCVPINNIPFTLTGQYKHNVPNIIKGIFVSDTDALQADFNGTKVWLSTYEMAEKYRHKEYVHKNIDKLFKKSVLTPYGLSGKFTCPKDTRWIDLEFSN